MIGKRNRRIKIRSVHTPLRLTSMMDILTVLLLFLLKSFVVEGEVMTPIPGVDLPESSSDTTPRAAVVIAIF
ncbi:MAG: biopolymer transporter ExbD, partial [Candidatus Krumholzibacteria bacterium]|nr:biopolymer transporter ExbD [Candidatus Krumholzibacteria bacterium]